MPVGQGALDPYLGMFVKDLPNLFPRMSRRENSQGRATAFRRHVSNVEFIFPFVCRLLRFLCAVIVSVVMVKAIGVLARRVKRFVKKGARRANRV